MGIRANAQVNIRKSNARPVEILAVALDTQSEDLLREMVPESNVQKMQCDLEKIMEATGPSPDLILCGLPPLGVSLNEVAQALRMTHSAVPIYCVCTARAGYDRKSYMKNGFSEVFLLPMDIDVLKRSVGDLVDKVSNGAVRSYRSVKLIDIQPGAVLDFDTAIFLPANKKYLKYSQAGDSLDEVRIRKLAAGKMNSIYVPSDQMGKFYEYSAKQLREMGSSLNLNATQKQDKLEGSIRELMSGIFNDSTKDCSFEHGKSLVKDCHEIVKSYIFDTPGGDLYRRILSVIGEIGNNYSHSANVSTYASLFSIGLQIGDPTELATAGLLHDIGLSDVPQAIMLKTESERSEEEKAIYRKHSEFGVEILKSRRLVLSETVLKAIEQHHECYNGTGFPQGLKGSRILKEAQIVALADHFDELTCAVEGKPRLTPPEAILKFKAELANDPGKMTFDPELLARVLKLFPQD